MRDACNKPAASDFMWCFGVLTALAVGRILVMVKL